MRNLLRKLCSPVLNYFETGEGQYVYKHSHRTILKVLGLLILILAIASLYFSIITSQAGGIIPIVIFFTVGTTCEIVGFLGSDRAVANIWKSK